MIKIVVINDTDFVAVQEKEENDSNNSENQDAHIWAFPVDEWMLQGGNLNDDRIMALFLASPNKYWASLYCEDKEQTVTEWHGPFDDYESAAGTMSAVYSLEATILRERKINREMQKSLLTLTA